MIYYEIHNHESISFLPNNLFKLLIMVGEIYGEKINDISRNTLDLCFKWYDFASRYNFALQESLAQSFLALFNSKNVEMNEIQNVLSASFDSALRARLNEEGFASCIGDFVNSAAKLAECTGYAQVRNIFYDTFLSASRSLEHIRDSVNRTPSEEITMRGRFSLLHYKPTIKSKHKTPVLVVYSLINRHYILDLMPEFSIVNSLLRQGLDVYATDWGTPDSNYADLTLEDYAHEYVENSVDKIKEITGSKQVSLLGYCWGGIFSLIYSVIHPENVKNLILHATPVDLEQTSDVIENWAKHTDADTMVKTFGNVPAGFLNTAFLLRNPVDAALKYFRFFSKPKSLEEVLQFFSIEAWLYDSVPIIGQVYKEIVNQVYKKNLLVQNKMKVGENLIDLKKITMPFLNIVGEKDDLVPPSSSKSIMNFVSSTDKKMIEFPTGHVGLCVSQTAHERLWPEVGRWLSQRS